MPQSLLYGGLIEKHESRYKTLLSEREMSVA